MGHPIQQIFAELCSRVSPATPPNHLSLSNSLKPTKPCGVWLPARYRPPWLSFFDCVFVASWPRSSFFPLRLIVIPMSIQKAYLRERRRRRRMDHHHHQPQQHRPTTDEGESDDMDEDHRLSSYEYGRDHSDGGSNSSSSNGQNGSNASRQADKPKKRRRKKNHFSGIQQMIAEVMDRNGGAAPFDLILTECQKVSRPNQDCS